MKDYYLDKHDIEGIEFGLEKIYKLLDILGNPQDKLNVIHIAGTNGKGSVSSYLAHILAYQGMRVGRISSPVVFEKMEFAQIYQLKDEAVCVYNASEDEYDRLVDKYKLEMDKIAASGYEVQVGFSLKYMLDKVCDIVIVECGMGGALDATNVFTHTLCDVITSISVDHIGMIGDTIEEITKCKCGIITSCGDVVTTSSNKSVMDIIKSSCKDRDAELKVAKIEDVSFVQMKWGQNLFSYNTRIDIEDNIDEARYEIALNGRHQIENAIIAIEVVQIVNEKLAKYMRDKYKIESARCGYDYIRQGLLDTRQRGRLDTVSENPFIIADGAHNEDGARCLVEAIDEYFGIENKRIIYFVSVFKDKDSRGIIGRILNNADEIVTFETDNPRCMDSKELQDVANQVILESKQTKDKAHNIMVNDIGHISNILRYIEEDKSDNIYICVGSLSFMRDIYGRF